MFSEATHRALETLFSLALLIAFLFVVVASIGCGGEVKATTTKPTIIITPIPSNSDSNSLQFKPTAPPPVEEAIATVPPPAVLKDTFFPPKAAVKLDANTYRACTCGDVCTCKDCPVDCNTVAANDCPGGVCRVPQRSVVKQSLTTGSSDCGSCGGVRRAALAPVRFVRERQPVRKAGGFVWRLFRRG